MNAVVSLLKFKSQLLGDAAWMLKCVNKIRINRDITAVSLTVLMYNIIEKYFLILTDIGNESLSEVLVVRSVLFFLNDKMK